MIAEPASWLALKMVGIGATELIILYAVLPLFCIVPAYRLALKKRYGQLAAAAVVATSIALIFINPLLAAVPLVFFLLAPDRTS